MKTKTKRAMHTATPWSFEIGELDGEKEAVIYKDDSGTIATLKNTDFSEVHENAAFIVRAVNAHEELVKLIKAMHTHYNEDMELKVWDDSKPCDCIVGQALAKAEGR